MVNAKVTVVNALKTVLPTYWEMTVDSDTVLPCITYRESNNYDYVTGDNLGYSYITYTLKLWANTVSDIATYSQQIDNKMRELGFKRDSLNEMTESSIICSMTTYTALAKEEYI